MTVGQIIGILTILAAYGLTWFFLVKSMRIVKIIDREGLRHSSEIKSRLRPKKTQKGG